METTSTTLDAKKWGPIPDENEQEFLDNEKKRFQSIHMAMVGKYRSS